MIHGKSRIRDRKNHQRIDDIEPNSGIYEKPPGDEDVQDEQPAGK